MLSKRPIGELVDKCRTWNPKASDAGSFNYIDLSSVDKDNKSIASVESHQCSEAPSRARQLVETGDVLVATVRPNLNGVALIDDTHHGMTASTGYCVLRPKKEKIDSRFLFHWVKTDAFVQKMIDVATGANYPAVSDAKVRASSLPLPPLAEQKRIARILDAADALRAKRRESLAQLDTLLQSTFLDMFGDPVTNPMGWSDSLRLGEVADIVSGLAKGRKLADQVTREVPYLAVVNVQDRNLVLTPLKRINATENEIRRYRLQNNDLLMTEGGDRDKLGRGTLWHNEIDECIHQNHVFRVRLHDDRLQPVFLNWLVGSARGKRYFLRQAKQTTGIASINLTQLRNFPLLIAPLDLQRRFATIVESIEQQKARQRAHLAELDTLFASLQQRAFNGEL
jgi:type I restriction enzyme S subunit